MPSEAYHYEDPHADAKAHDKQERIAMWGLPVRRMTRADVQREIDEYGWAWIGTSRLVSREEWELWQQ